MADTVEQQNIRGLDIDKTVKGFALVEYQFKNECTITGTSGDSIRWYQETAADLTATAPSKNANISPLSTFPTLEVSWTRNTSYVRKYANEGFISMEDIKTADIDVLARSLLRLTRAVVKQVDARIWSVLTDGYDAAQAVSTTINSVATNAAWNTGSFTGVDIIEDVMDAKLQIYNNNYNPEGATLWLSPTDHKNMLDWLITSKGSSIPAFASARVSDGVVMNFLGLNVKVSTNVTASGALVVIPKTAATWKQLQDTTARVIEEPGMGSKIRVWEIGEAILTDPKAVCLIYNTQTHA